MARTRQQDDPLAALLAAAPAGVLADLLIDVLRDAPRWRAFALKIKQDNIKRPAFQEEFAKAVPGWRELGLHS